MPSTARRALMQETSESNYGQLRCLRCNAAFRCGMRAGDEHCWCAERPAALAVPGRGERCYCPRCLEELIAERARG